MTVIGVSLFYLLTFSPLHAYTPRPLVWTSQSRNSSESMPCGGHDIGLNVWVEQHIDESQGSPCYDLLFYAQQSGWFDENNTLLKAGRWRLHFDGDPFNSSDFQQELRLDDGAIYIKGKGLEVRIWVDVFSPVLFVAMKSQHTERATLSYESWRYRDRPVTKAECQQCSYKWLIPAECTTFADSIQANGNRLTFSHKNREQTVFDYTVHYEHLDAIKDSLYNPIGGLLMQGEMRAPGFQFIGTSSGTYASTDYRSWNFRNEKLRKATIKINLQALPLPNGRGAVTSSAIYSPFIREGQGEGLSRTRSARWWHEFWQRSWIETDGSNEEAARMVRNYELMRYLLGCNAYGQWPTKFNGGLFTFDPVYVDSTMTFTPDYRKWGGGTMTAQNQRLVYWPMLKSGDYDLLQSQLDTYLRMLPNAIARTRYYWGHDGACFTEQIENFGLPNPAEYGKHPEGSDYGVERNAWLEYEWDTALEFAMMGLLSEKGRVNKFPLSRLPVAFEKFATTVLRFFDEHYQWQAKQLGTKALDENGKLIIYPGSGCETYKMAYNPSSTIAALQTVATFFLNDNTKNTNNNLSKELSELSMLSLINKLPDIPLRVIDGGTCIAPAIIWTRIQNVETPQLYPVWPWRIYGLGRPGLDIARNTYWKDPHAIEMRSSKGWKQDNIWAACLGLTGEARRLNVEKLSDGPYRFPAFWDPGFDWAPDHNRGGAGMIGLQEMLLQETADGQLLLFPAWPREWNCRFRLHATDGRTVEASIQEGKIKVTPNGRTL